LSLSSQLEEFAKAQQEQEMKSEKERFLFGGKALWASNQSPLSERRNIVPVGARVIWIRPDLRPALFLSLKEGLTWKTTDGLFFI
jgi:hypothetical protein